MTDYSNDYLNAIKEQDSIFQEIKDKLEREEADLRFKRPWIAASNIAQQYYCEKKVELQFLLGEVDTESKQIGRQAHDTLLADTVKTSREEIFKRIYSGKPVVVHEMFLLAHYKDTLIVGKPDAVVFNNRVPLLLFEYKFSRSPIPYQSHQVQANVYCKILESIGFNVNQLHYVIAIAPPLQRENEKLFKTVFNAVLKNDPKEDIIKVEQATVYIYKYHSSNAEGDLDWALKYWKNIREAIPTTNLNKCKACEYFMNCEKNA